MSHIVHVNVFLHTIFRQEEQTNCFLYDKGIVGISNACCTLTNSPPIFASFLLFDDSFWCVRLTIVKFLDLLLSLPTRRRWSSLCDDLQQWLGSVCKNTIIKLQTFKNSWCSYVICRCLARFPARVREMFAWNHKAHSLITVSDKPWNITHQIEQVSPSNCSNSPALYKMGTRWNVFSMSIVIPAIHASRWL